MTTKASAVYSFLSGFGIPAYATTAVPDDAAMPYLTYDLSTGAWGDGDVSMLVNLWYYGDSEKPANDKAQEISDAIGLGGSMVSYNGGGMWIKRGTPFCQSISDEPKVKRRYINIDIEFISND